MAPSSLMTSATTVSSSSGRGEPSRPDLRVVALGGGTGLPTVLRGLRVEGESRLAGARSPIRRLRLHPSDASALPEAMDALERSDLIVIGPGSLYSSLVAVLLVPELPKAIARSRARVVLVLNLMTEPGETDGHTGVDHLMAIRHHAPTIPIHDILVNTAPFAPEQLARYAPLGAGPVPADVELLKALGHSVVECDLLATGDDARHDPGKLGRALLARVS